MVQALIFDVFGTCVDWRNSVARAVSHAIPGVDALAFADAWRGQYQPAMQRIRAQEREYVPLEILHLENMRHVAERFDVTAPDSLNDAWQQLDPWPDVNPGLVLLKRSFLIAPCSNGSIAMMARLARHGGLPWDCVLGADLAKDYKPNPNVYLAACSALALPPAEVMMVAAHNDDLFAARDAGLATAFVARPTEHGTEQTTDLSPEADWDVVVGSFVALARALQPA